MKRKLKKVFIGFIIIIVVLLITFMLFGTSLIRYFFPSRALEYGRKCDSVSLGSSAAEVTAIMGNNPDYTRGGKNNVTMGYVPGGLQTNAGIAFELVDGRLVKKFCGEKWEPK